MRLGFTGTRRGLTVPQLQALTAFMESVAPCALSAHHGDCVGADARFHDICRGLSIPIVLHPPAADNFRAWYRDAASVLQALSYLDRNRCIVDEVDLMVATPDGPERVRAGTWSAIRYARSLRKELRIILPDGTQLRE